MAKANTFTFNVPGASVWIEYNPASKNIQSASWELPDNVKLTVTVWDSNIDPVDPVLIRQITGPSVSSENIPGNYKMVLFTDPESGDSWDDLPPNITYSFNVEITGS